MSVQLAGTASLGVRSLVSGPHRRGRVIAAFPAASYVELPASGPEPCILALVTPAAVALPIAVIVERPAGRGAARDGSAPPAQAAEASCLDGLTAGGDAVVGGGVIETGLLRVAVRHWWDPAPVLVPLSRQRLQAGCAALRALCASSPRQPGLGEDAGPAVLAARCAAGDAPGAAGAVRRLLGLGPGLTPSGDDMVAGLLLALRVLGGATAGGTRAVWLADRLAATVTRCARDRTTVVSAALLHCAARGQAAAEVIGVLRAFEGREPAGPAVTRLLAVGHTSGADLAWGLAAACAAVLALPA